MSILINKHSRVICQGITGIKGTYHTKRAIDYGTNMVGGVTPGKGGTKHLGLNVYNTVSEAVIATGADTSIIYVPAKLTLDAILEAIDSNIKTIVCITEGIPASDMLKVHHALRNSETKMIGPNCPGVITPGECKLGIMPPEVFSPGRVGVISRSGTLTYEAGRQTTIAGLGQSTCVGIGGDSMPGMSFTSVLKLFLDDKDTDCILMVGEIGGTAEQEAADMIKEYKIKKPVVGFVAGITAPPEKRMGHAGAIITSVASDAVSKIEYMKKADIEVATDLSEIGLLVSRAMKKF